MKKITLLGFRGAAESSPDYDQFFEKDPLLVAGHVGILFEGDNRIFGFHPTLEAIEAAGGKRAAVIKLLRHERMEGSVQDDTQTFLDANELADSGERTTVYQLIYEFPDEQFNIIRDQIFTWYDRGTVFWYNFPYEEGSFEDDEYNCAIFPGAKLKLPIPTYNGRLKVYIQEMWNKGATQWQP